MKNWLLLFVSLFSAPLLAAQCHVNIKNEVRLDGKNMEIRQANGDKAVINQNNQLIIKGQRVALDHQQTSALDEYRQRMNAYLPKVKQFSDDTLARADALVDDIANGLDAPHAFDNVKKAVADYAANIQNRYYDGKALVIPADTFKSLTQTWKEDAAKVRAVLNTEFISSAFNVLKDKLSTENGLDFTALSDTMAQLKAKVQQKAKEQAKEVNKQAQGLCDSLDKSANDEQQLLKKIPQLKDYQVFSI